MRRLALELLGKLRGFPFVAALLLLLTLVSPAAVSAQVTYVYTNERGSPVAESDSSGTVVARYHYSPYGQLLDGAAPVGSGFDGHYQDPETGFLYMQARYYDPEIGRFLSADPVQPIGRRVDSFGIYTFEGNNPINALDPDGRQNLEPAEPRIEDRIEVRASYSVSTELSGRVILFEIRKLDPTYQLPASVGPIDGPFFTQGMDETLERDLERLRAAKGEIELPQQQAGQSYVEIRLRYKEGWTAAQRAAADAKVAALNDSLLRYTPGPRGGTAGTRRYRASFDVGPHQDVDHIVDRQLGGEDVSDNMQGLDRSVNRSLGAQIRWQTRGLPAGTVINRVTIGE